MADLNGTWLGTYWQMGMPTRFELVLLQAGNSLSGSVLDDSYLGEAKLSGTLVGRQVRFNKRYVSTRQAVVDYVGTVSEDEDFIQGNWSIGSRYTGPWEARRSGESLSLAVDDKVERKVPAEMGIR